MKIIVLLCALCAFPAAFAQRSTVCQDKVDYYTCYNWMYSGMCTDPSHRELAMQNCRYTCNLCYESWSTNDVADNNGEVCKDNRSTCSKWLKHCRHNSAYYEFMTENCQRTCGFCEDEKCVDINKRCAKYKKRHYCNHQHTYHAFMKKNCELTCNLCKAPKKSGVETTLKTPLKTYLNLKKEYFCDFESDECDWINQPFDDTADWTVGHNEIGPAKGFKSSSSYLYLADGIYEGYYANLLLPWQLFLPDGVTSIGRMCLHFMYTMTDGKITVSQRGTPSSQNKFPPTVVKFTAKTPTLQWKHAAMDVMVTDRYELVIKGVKGAPKSYLAIDYLFFTRGGCY